MSIRNLFRYFYHYVMYISKGGRASNLFPILDEFTSQAGTASGHYFHQDLLVAQFIFKLSPEKHIDIGSRIDGFVAHVASFREVEVMDVRNLKKTVHNNISFFQADLMKNSNLPVNIADSISCLHAVEHFGLGRYGDAIDPKGHIKGFNNMLSMLKINGTLFISFPISNSNQVHFNAHRVFHPKDILTWAYDETCLILDRFDYVDDFGDLNLNVDLNITNIDVNYGCGIYTLKKIK